MLMEYQPQKDATAHGVSLFCGRTGKEEKDCEVPEHTHRSISVIIESSGHDMELGGAQMSNGGRAVEPSDTGLASAHWTQKHRPNTSSMER
ncbi:jg14222 [Pararge aegeria aegeria]|uniref:Jg14222 protein n=1 Tax=Pararge aegeria aegeria TaxID=348720 RepID=A0A8S4RV12_9NEOP|nr:jg14222 [Pararge aegeria aegeria]